jgi:hypothetical protein
LQEAWCLLHDLSLVLLENSQSEYTQAIITMTTVIMIFTLPLGENRKKVEKQREISRPGLASISPGGA